MKTRRIYCSGDRLVTKAGAVAEIVGIFGFPNVYALLKIIRPAIECVHVHDDKFSVKLEDLDQMKMLTQDALVAQCVRS